MIITMYCDQQLTSQHVRETGNLHLHGKENDSRPSPIFVVPQYGAAKNVWSYYLKEGVTEWWKKTMYTIQGLGLFSVTSHEGGNCYVPRKSAVELTSHTGAPPTR
jgi:hypothetical protein